MELDAGTTKTSPQGVGSFPGMVMRDLAVDVMGNVSLRDTVGACGSDPGHDGSEATEEVTIVSRQGTAREGELVSTIVREEGVGVLQESDHHEPVVDPGNRHESRSTARLDARHVPEVRNDVGTEDLKESKLVDRVVQADNPE